MNTNGFNVIKDKKYPNERALYAASNLRLVNCVFDGTEDGESALKEAQNVAAENCLFNLRYPLWHDTGVMLSNVTLTENCRAALWYSRDVEVERSSLLGIKALRECRNVAIADSEIVSPEFGWRSDGVTVAGGRVTSEYLFLNASDVTMCNVDFKGKYSFQYTKNVTVENCVLDTKDAFWHAENVTVCNSVVKGEYLAWYSHNVTFEHCKIVGTQPLCYCDNLTLIDCELVDTDLAFEYSTVNATVKGNVLSVKNPRGGRIVADSIGEVILTADSKYPCDCQIIQLNK